MSHWTPLALTGRGLVAWWDSAHAPSRTVDASGRITAWRDRVRGLALVGWRGTQPLCRHDGWLYFDSSDTGLITVP
ncbi:MAG: hypothetical protein ACRC1H_09705, partial [Caldilineaceae bacterium]